MSVFDEGVTRVGELTVWETLKRENTSVHGLLVFDRSILKSPIKIISLDSSQTTSIIDTNLSVQFAGSEGFRYRNPTRNEEVFCSLTSSQIHSTPYLSNSVRRVTDIVSWTYTTWPVSLWICGSFLITWNPSIAMSLSSMWLLSLDSEKQNIWKPLP